MARSRKNKSIIPPLIGFAILALIAVYPDILWTVGGWFADIFAPRVMLPVTPQ